MSVFYEVLMILMSAEFSLVMMMQCGKPATLGTGLPLVGSEGVKRINFLQCRVLQGFPAEVSRQLRLPDEQGVALVLLDALLRLALFF